MIHLTYSNRTEDLLEALAHDLARARGASHPLEPLRLVVPNRNVETWVKQGLASRLGIAANLEFLYLHRFVQGLLEDGRGQALLDGRELLDGVLAALLDEELLQRPVLAPVRAYLDAGGDEASAVAKRRHQLALQLSRLYEEYGYSRPDMLQGWAAGQGAFEGAAGAVEAWQRELWLEVLARKEGRVPFPTFLASLDRLALGGKPVFFFGISYVASAFHRIFGRLAEEGTLHVYTLNPCREFWEDAETEAETARRLRRTGASTRGEDERDPFGLETAEENPALALWGRPGRENIRLLNELADCDFREVFSAPPGETLLHRLQRDILERRERREAPEPMEDPRDRSVEILACPGARREAETIAAEIWSLVEADPTLRFHEIAVLVAGKDPDTTFGHLAAAFQENHRIPYSLSDLSFASRSPISAAVDALLRLPTSRLERGEVLAFLTHPAVLAVDPEAGSEAWTRLTDRLGIILGADRSELEDTYLEEDLLSWDQGLRRLALGAFLPGGITGPARPIELDGPLPGGRAAYLPVEGEGAWETYGALVRSLISDLRFVRDARLPTSEWARLLESLIRTYLHPRGEAEERELDRCLVAVRRVAELPLAGKAIDASLVLELARAELEALGGSVGSYLGEGVAISTFQPMRAIPFRAIFIVGLGEGEFPAADRVSEIDLRQVRFQVGDVSARESDQYMFLEAILCARERLILSYQAKDEQTGEPLPPSPVLDGLLRVVKSEYGVEPDRLIRRVPLRPWDGGGADRHPAPGARREREVVRLRGALGDRLDEASQRRLEELLGRAPLPEEGGARELGELSLSQLRSFLFCPLQGSVQALLGLRPDEEDPADLQAEPFEAGILEELSLLRGTFAAWLRAGGAEELSSLYLARREAMRLAGAVASGAFGRFEEERHLELLHRWADAMGGGGRQVEVVRFGGGEEDEPVDAALDPLPLLGGSVALRGRTELLLDRATTLLLLGREVGARERVLKEELRIFLDGVILAAAGLREGPFTGWILDSGATELREVQFGAVSRDQAIAYLEALVEDVRAGPHPFFLPWEAVLDWEAGERKKDLTHHVDDWRRDFRRPRSIYGPVRNPKDMPGLPEDEARAAAERRYGLFFATREPIA